MKIKLDELEALHNKRRKLSELTETEECWSLCCLWNPQWLRTHQTVFDAFLVVDVFLAFDAFLIVDAFLAFEVFSGVNAFLFDAFLPVTSLQGILVLQQLDIGSKYDTKLVRL